MNTILFDHKKQGIKIYQQGGAQRTLSRGLTIYKHLILRCHLLCVKSPSSSMSLNAFLGVAVKINFEFSWEHKTDHQNDGS